MGLYAPTFGPDTLSEYGWPHTDFFEQVVRETDMASARSGISHGARRSPTRRPDQGKTERLASRIMTPTLGNGSVRGA
jgi:hypothetical protein